MSADTAGVVFSVQALIWLAVGGPGGAVRAARRRDRDPARPARAERAAAGHVAAAARRALIAVVLGAPRGLTGLAAQRRHRRPTPDRSRPPPREPPHDRRCASSARTTSSAPSRRCRRATAACPAATRCSATVDRLRDGQPTIWADAGDFSNGGPLSATSGAALSFRAVDAAGHRGRDARQPRVRPRPRSRRGAVRGAALPVVCANVDAGVPADRRCWTTEAGPVGFIGLTHPQVAAFTPHAPEADTDLARIVAHHARRAAAQGAIAVVVLFHFGVTGRSRPTGRTCPTRRRCWRYGRRGATGRRDRARAHARALGRRDRRRPVRAAVGVRRRGRRDRPRPRGGAHRVELVPVDADDARAWTGPGRAAIEQAEREVVGHIGEPLTIDFGDDISLADFAADALREATGASAAVVPVVGMHQPAIEGVMYHWPAGPVSEADVARFWPWNDDRCLWPRSPRRSSTRSSGSSRRSHGSRGGERRADDAAVAAHDRRPARLRRLGNGPDRSAARARGRVASAQRSPARRDAHVARRGLCGAAGGGRGCYCTGKCTLGRQGRGISEGARRRGTWPAPAPLVRLAIVDRDSGFVHVLGKRVKRAAWQQRVLSCAAAVERAGRAAARRARRSTSRCSGPTAGTTCERCARRCRRCR